MSRRAIVSAAALGVAALTAAPFSRAQVAPAPGDETFPPFGPRTPPAPPPSPHGTAPEAPAAPPSIGTTQTTSAQYNEYVPAERTQTIVPNRPMLVTGAALFAAPYVAGVIVAAQSNIDADHRLYIPVVGPWLDLGQRPCSFGSTCTNGDNVAGVLLVASGVAQGVGVLLAAASFAVPEKNRAYAGAPAKPHVSVVPVSFAGGGGIGATGTF